jgi:hypothetical protein
MVLPLDSTILPVPSLLNVQIMNLPSGGLDFHDPKSWLLPEDTFSCASDHISENVAQEPKENPITTANATTRNKLVFFIVLLLSCGMVYSTEGSPLDAAVITEVQISKDADFVPGISHLFLLLLGKCGSSTVITSKSKRIAAYTSNSPGYYVSTSITRTGNTKRIAT